MEKMNSHKRVFWVEPLAGLGNRMQVLASAYFLTQKYHKRLCILWNNNGDLAADFEELFEPVPNVEIITVTTDGYRVKPLLRVKSEQLRKKLSQTCSFVTEVDKWTGMEQQEISAMVEAGVRDAEDIYIKSWKPFSPVYEDSEIRLDFLKPSKKVLLRGKTLFDRIGIDTVGVHIRRTDHKEAILNSPVEIFFQEMQKEAEQDPVCRFFVATDDREVEREVSNRFGEHAFFKEDKSWGRDREDGMLDACVDLWALSKCRKILGSRGSTFGMIAAKLGSKELKIVTK